MFGLFKKKLPLGVDIGHNSIKIVEIKNSNPLPELKNYLLKKLPSRIVNNGRLKDERALIEILKHLKEEKDLKKDKVVLGLAGERLIIKKLKLPVMEKIELKKSIGWEIDDYLPFSWEKASIDYQILNQTTNKMEVLVAAIRDEIVFQYASVLEKAGFKVKAVDLQCLGLQRLLKNRDSFNKENLILVDLGARKIEMIFFKKGSFNFRRSFKFNCDKLASELKEASIELKKYNKKDIKRQKSKKINSLKKLLNEIELLLYQLANKDELDRIVLTGGGAMINDLSLLLSRVLKVKVEKFNLLNKVQFNPRNFSPHLLREKMSLLSAAVGLTLRGLDI